MSRVLYFRALSAVPSLKSYFAKDSSKVHRFFCYYPTLRTYFCVHVFCLTLPQIAWLEIFFPNSYATTWNRTHVSSVAPLWGTLTQGAIQTEPLRLRHKSPKMMEDRLGFKNRHHVTHGLMLKRQLSKPEIRSTVPSRLVVCFVLPPYLVSMCHLVNPLGQLHKK